MENISNPGMFPNSRSGQDDGIKKKMHTLTTSKEVRAPTNPEHQPLRRSDPSVLTN